MKSSPFQPTISVVVPVYNGADTIKELVDIVSALDFDGSVEMILVNDCSTDNSWEILKLLAACASIPLTVVNHSRNFGEHNAVLTGLRHTRGEFVITMDDDMQNPRPEILKLYTSLRDSKLDVIYAFYAKKMHVGWRNLGSNFANFVATWILDKPNGIYLSTFRCMRRFLVDQIIKYHGPFVYLDGLIFQITNRAGNVLVEHLPNKTGRSNYTLTKLVRLWLIMFIAFSVKPLRLSVSIGLIMFGLGIFGTLWVVLDRLLFGTDMAGWASLASIIMVYTGTQFLLLGLLGEYVGRAFLMLNGKPQSVVREIVHPSAASGVPANSSASEQKRESCTKPM